MEALMKIAHPYAKAAFEIASSKQAIPLWKTYLHDVALIASNQDIFTLIHDPNIKREEILNLFFSVLGGELDEEQKNFLFLLAENRRMRVLPQINEIFLLLYEEQEKRIPVRVTTTMALTSSQNAELKQALEKRLKRQVDLQEKVDEDLLGGAIVRAGDWVIDGSGREQLARLEEYLKGKGLCN